MTARLLDGTALSRALRADLAVRAEALADRGHRPGLSVVLVGDDPASQIYVRNKAAACHSVGIRSEVHRLPRDTGQDALLEMVERLDADPAIDGILIQLPLPAQLSAVPAIEAISIGKDVDGFHALSAGNLLTGRMGDGVGFRPCTPYGIMELLDAAKIPIRGAQAVVIGRSNTVGKPMAVMLLERDATVTICHSATRDLAAFVRNADIVVVAVGRAGTVTAEMVKPGAAVVDVGMNRDAAGKLVGDVDFDPVSAVAGWITPVPGGVGPMTITMLLTNTILSAERRHAAQLPAS